MTSPSYAAVLASMLLLALPQLSQGQTTTVVRTVQLEYDAYGQVLRETVEPNDVTLKVVTEYERLPVGGVDYGLVSNKTVKWTDPVSGVLQTRVVQRFTYDAQGRYPLTSSNALNQSETRTYSDAHGNILTLQDPNNLTTSWQYDAWGRKTRETRPDNSATSWAYRQCVDSCAEHRGPRSRAHDQAVFGTGVPGKVGGDRGGGDRRDARREDLLGGRHQPLSHGLVG